MHGKRERGPNATAGRPDQLAATSDQASDARHRTGVSTNLPMASATATGLSIGTHVLAPGTGDQRGAGELGRESLRVSHREEGAPLAPDQQYRLVEPGDRLGGIDEELRSQTSQGRDEIADHPLITLCWPEERFCALVVQSARGDAGDDLASADRRSKL